MPFKVLILIFLFLAPLSAAAHSKNSFCPKISVVGPAGLTQTGEEMTFAVKVEPMVPNIRYEWVVEGADIAEGQGTAQIKVVGGLKDAKVRATVTLKGVSNLCQSTAYEESFFFQAPFCGAPSDEWGDSKTNDVSGRLDSFFAELANNPTQTGMIIFEAADSEKRDFNNSRLKLIVKHAKYRKFDLGRFVFFFEIGQFDRSRTKLYRISPDAELPCDGCVRINGSDLSSTLR